MDSPVPQRLDLFLPGQLNVTLLRLCHQLIEHHVDFKNTVLLAIQPRGVYLGRRVHALLQGLLPDMTLPYGELDVTFFRDDVRRHASPLLANATKVDFLVEGKRVILVDDVLYTGRTIRAALDAMLAFGRPASVELLVLVDRKRQRELPVEAMYTGISIDVLPAEKVIVRLREGGGQDTVRIESR
jgi:pyrimidine operon attenuation protein/uracil phosphoribosyltransferase